MCLLMLQSPAAMKKDVQAVLIGSRLTAAQQNQLAEAARVLRGKRVETFSSAGATLGRYAGFIVKLPRRKRNETPEPAGGCYSDVTSLLFVSIRASRVLPVAMRNGKLATFGFRLV